MSKNHHTSRENNFLQNVLALKKLTRKILKIREELKKAFIDLQQLLESISKELKK